MKKHDILNKIEADLAGVTQTTAVTIKGTVYRLKLLSREEEVRAQSMVTEDTIVAAFAASNLPQMALSITHIDAVPVGELFIPETDEEKKEPIESWRGNKMAEWLSKRPGVVLEKLFLKYLDMKAGYYAAMEQGVENLSEPTPSGE